MVRSPYCGSRDRSYPRFSRFESFDSVAVAGFADLQQPVVDLFVPDRFWVPVAPVVQPNWALSRTVYRPDYKPDTVVGVVDKQQEGVVASFVMPLGIVRIPWH